MYLCRTRMIHTHTCKYLVNSRRGSARVARERGGERVEEERRKKGEEGEYEDGERGGEGGEAGG